MVAERNTVEETLAQSEEIAWSDGGLRSLPETSNLPSVFIFAECINSGTRRTSSLPSAALKTPDKKKPQQNGGLPSVKKNTRQREGLPSVFFFALGEINKIFFIK